MAFTLFRFKEWQKKYKELQENVVYTQQIAQIGTWTRDYETKSLFITDELCRILGCNPFEFKGDSEIFMKHVHEGDRQWVQEYMSKVQQGSDYDIEYRIVTESGEHKIVRERTKTIYDQEKPIRTFGVMQDITEKKRMENDLRELGDVYIRAQKVSGVGSFKYDAQNNLSVWSDEVCRIYGVDPNCFKGNIDEILEQTHPQDRQKLQEAIDQGLKGKSFKTEYRIIRKDQTIRTVIAKAEPLYGKEGKVGGLIGTIQDITDYKALEQRLKKNLNLLTQVQALAKLGSWELDLTVEKGLTCSEETLKIYGISSEEWEYTYEGFLKRVYPQDKKIIDEIWEDIPKKPFEMEFRIVRSDGAVRNVHQRIEVIFNEKEEPVRAYGIIQDITEKKKLEEEIRQKQKEVQKVQKRFQVLIGKSNDVFEIIDREGIVRYVSEAVEKITGFKPEERIGRSIYSFFKQTNKNSLEYNIKRLLEHPDREMHGVVTPNLKTNEEKFLDVRMQNMLKEPAVEGIVLHYRDITRQLEMEERLAYLSTHDEWTQLPNRLYFKKEYKKLCDRAREDKTGFAILMLKVSGISYAVYSLGYDYGQFLFLKIVERLKTYLGEDYLIARYAEEHLAIIAQGFSRQEEYEKLVGQIIALFEAPFKIGDYELDVSVNIGVCIYSQSEKWDVEALKKQALAALLQARKEGKNTYKFFSADLDIAHYKEFTLRKDLRNALEEEQFSIHYQPIVNMKTNEILAAEALIRWEHPDWGLVPPHDFLHLAEETGIMIEIGYWVIRETCKSYRKWLDQGYPSIKIALNLSSVQFLEKEFVENLQAIVHEYDLDPKFLILEMTESVLVKKRDKAGEDIEKLQSMGIDMTIDDFGTGFSSLASLDRYDFNLLKIDRFFIKRIMEDPKAAAITKSVITLAKELEIKLVAEGIENWDQLSFLRDHHCYAGQGYLFSKPLAIEQFELMLKSGKCKPTYIRKRGSMPEKDRRKYFRVHFQRLLEAKMTILEISGKKVDVGNTKVLIKNMGPGGLCFVSNIVFPVENELVLRFVTELMEKELRVKGSLVWMEEVDERIFEYGVKFEIDEDERTHLVKELSQIQIKMRKDIVFVDGSFTKASPYRYFNAKKNEDKEE